MSHACPLCMRKHHGPSPYCGDECAARCVVPPGIKVTGTQARASYVDRSVSTSLKKAPQ